MSVDCRIARVIGAGAREFPASGERDAFSVVDLATSNGGATIFLPAGHAEAVAAAIRAAIDSDGPDAQLSEECQ